MLDATARTPLIEENVPASMEVHTREGHPYRWSYGPCKDPRLVAESGEKLKEGSHDSELIDVLPVEQFGQVEQVGNGLHLGIVASGHLWADDVVRPERGAPTPAK